MMQQPDDPLLQAMRRGDVMATLQLMRGPNGIDTEKAKAALMRYATQSAQQDSAQMDKPAHEGITVLQRPAMTAQQLRDRTHQASTAARPPTVAAGDTPGQMGWLVAIIVMIVFAIYFG